MALPKRGTRLITVGGVRYRWAVSPDSGYSWLVVQRAGGTGPRIEAKIDDPERAVTPADARRVIEAARARVPAAGRRGTSLLRVKLEG